MSRVVVIAGATATGKTRLGIELARRLGGEIISADSMQLYRGMDIGTAKPTRDEMRGITHHMISVASPAENYSAARYAREAGAAADDILAREKLPIIVGGTGLYIDALIYGRAFTVPGDAALRSELDAEYDALGGAAMLLRLRGFDPITALRLSPSDRRRIIRATEVYRLTGEPISAHDAKSRLTPPRFDAVRFSLNYRERGVLYARIDARVDEMLSRGLVGEVKSLLRSGVSRSGTA
ncbi:MAG: tRNA (adenosine(37)-N6)-dimethylallyltransferase MiaA, partial [Oscillospiraceae bacterium]|nr:tRNA (adenosine(37)-N6)-dimethylallyltransferase MiaA [Oscillospiraceae bacterium]